MTKLHVGLPLLGEIKFVVAFAPDEDQGKRRDKMYGKLPSIAATYSVEQRLRGLVKDQCLNSRMRSMKYASWSQAKKLTLY